MPAGSIIIWEKELSIDKNRKKSFIIILDFILVKKKLSVYGPIIIFLLFIIGHITIKEKSSKLIGTLKLKIKK